MDKPKPFVKWAGGKTRLLPQLIKMVPPQYDAYYEPFVGGGALFFALQPKQAHLNDINQTLMLAYRLIQKESGYVIAALGGMEYNYYHSTQEDGFTNHNSLEQKSNDYYLRRDQFNSIEGTTLHKAILLLFLNKTCFNGMYRENSQGKFNVPFGKYENPKIVDAANLRLVHDALQSVTLTSVDYREAVASAGPDDFVYLDPPYHPLNETAQFTQYSADGFTLEDQTRLRDLVNDLTQRGCKVMASNSNTPFIRDLYRRYHLHEVLAGRSINCQGDGRGKITELVICNYPVQATNE